MRRTPCIPAAPRRCGCRGRGMSLTDGSSSHSRVSPTVTSRRANTIALPWTTLSAAATTPRDGRAPVVHASAWAPNTETPRARSTSSIDAVQRGFTSIGCITTTVVDEVDAADTSQAERCGGGPRDRFRLPRTPLRRRQKDAAAIAKAAGAEGGVADKSVATDRARRRRPARPRTRPTQGDLARISARSSRAGHCDRANAEPAAPPPERSGFTSQAPGCAVVNGPT